MTILYHATKLSNLRSIGIGGLLTSKSLGKLKAVWLHTPSRMAWAILHVSKRHKCDPRDVVILPVRVGRVNRVRRGGGLWYSLVDVPRSAIGAAIRCEDVAGVVS